LKKSREKTGSFLTGVVFTAAKQRSSFFLLKTFLSYITYF